MARDCAKGPIGQDTIRDLGQGVYAGIYAGGLYGGGRNAPMPGHHAALAAAADAVEPLDASGQPDPSGIVGLLGFGFSDAKLTWPSILDALATMAPAPRIELRPIDGAHAGYDADDWSNPAHAAWTKHIPAQLAAAGVTYDQVQVAWLMTGIANVTLGFPAHVADLQAKLATIARLARAAFPNLRLLYLDTVPGQHYLGAGAANYEPTYFEQGFAVQQLIAQQVGGDLTLNFNPARGIVLAPVVDWGGAFWCDATAGDSLGRAWACRDVMPDGHHPSQFGQPKLAAWLVDRWRADGVACRWLIGAPSISAPPAPPPTQSAG